MSERFAVGDAVTYRDISTGAMLQCRVMRVMPTERGIRLYHVRDVAENFERAVIGASLTRVRATSEDQAFKPARPGYEDVARAAGSGTRSLSSSS
jgi:hypothetical protein